MTGFIKNMLTYSNTQYKLRFFFINKGFMEKVLIKLYLCVKYAVLRVISPRKAHLPYLEIVVTNRCNMRCVKCANLIPYIKSPGDFPIDDLEGDTKALLDAVSGIDVVKLLGGEPFLHKDLPHMIKLLAANPKVRYLEIVTNGRIIPSDEIILLLKSSPVMVSVSPYGKNEKIIKLFESEGIKYTFAQMESWKDFGGFEPRGRDAQENEKIFKKCVKCITLIDGRVYYCPRSGNGSKIGLVPEIEAESVNLRSNAVAEQIKKWLRLRCISTCDYCDYDGPDIPIAEQAKGYDLINE